MPGLRVPCVPTAHAKTAWYRLPAVPRLLVPLRWPGRTPCASVCVRVRICTAELQTLLLIIAALPLRPQIFTHAALLALHRAGACDAGYCPAPPSTPARTRTMHRGGAFPSARVRIGSRRPRRAARCRPSVAFLALSALPSPFPAAASRPWICRSAPWRRTNLTITLVASTALTRLALTSRRHPTVRQRRRPARPAAAGSEANADAESARDVVRTWQDTDHADRHAPATTIDPARTRSISLRLRHRPRSVDTPPPPGPSPTALVGGCAGGCAAGDRYRR